MIIGIGTDIIEIDRIKKALENERFILKCFTVNEIELFKDKRYETAAGNFACKEAVAKALGSGFRGFSLQDVEILRDGLNKPVVYIHNGALKRLKELNGTNILASISHSNTYATAVAIIEGGN